MAVLSKKSAFMDEAKASWRIPFAFANKVELSILTISTRPSC